MPIPLPPTIYGPITPITPEVLVKGVVPGADVFIIETRRVTKTKALKTQLGTGKASVPGGLYVKLTTKPTVGRSVTAEQKTKHGESGPSWPVIVVDTPLPLGTPRIASALNTCMAGIWVDALTPGASLIASIAGKQVVGAKVTRTYQYFNIDPAATISNGSVIEVYQQIKRASQLLHKSLVLKSLPIASLNVEEGLQPPQLALPLKACDTSILVAAVTPGTVVHIDNGGQSSTFASPGTSFKGPVAPLKPGPLVAMQEMPRCKLTSKNASYTVDPPGSPPEPIVQQELCADVPSFTASQLTPGGFLFIKRIVNPPGGKKIPSEPRFCSIDSTTQKIDLPLDWLTDSNGPVTLELYQIHCSVQGGSTEVAVAIGGGPYKPPKVLPPVYPCVGALRVSGAHPGSYVQAFNAKTNQPISDMKPAPAADFLLELWFPTTGGMPIFVRQTGCNADGDSQPPVTVLPLPDPLPTPTPEAPIRPGANAVRLGDVLPGARVFVRVDGIVRAEADCWVETPTLYIPGKALEENQKVFPLQSLCDRWSSKDGPSVTVTKGDMSVSVSPKTVPFGAVTSQITVTATDVDTHADIHSGQVFLNSKLVGMLGLPFPFTPGSQASPISGEVQSVGYKPAFFEVFLEDWYLDLYVKPAFMDSNLPLLVEKADWTITPDWNPSLVQTTSDTEPEPKDVKSAPTGGGFLHRQCKLPVPSPGKANTVRIQLQLQCRVIWGGGYLPNGPYVNPGGIPTISDPVTVAYAGSNEIVNWMIKIETYEQNGQQHPQVHAAK